jgi:hypothetical protein
MSKLPASSHDEQRQQVSDNVKDALDQEESRILAERIFYAANMRQPRTLYPRTLAVFSSVLSEN